MPQLASLRDLLGDLGFGELHHRQSLMFVYDATQFLKFKNSGDKRIPSEFTGYHNLAVSFLVEHERGLLYWPAVPNSNLGYVNVYEQRRVIQLVERLFWRIQEVFSGRRTLAPGMSSQGV
ncbi:hypothetical protein MY10362_004768, partial [Beauveria mimosiformis]